MIWQEWFRDQFLSTPSARRATAVAVCRQLLTEHFYPRPPRGGRPSKMRPMTLKKIFLSTPSARRATYPNLNGDLCFEFLSTPSARRATRASRRCRSSPKISIHALREEGDVISKKFADELEISIHALREEGDPLCARAVTLHRYFYPRPPRGGRQFGNWGHFNTRLFLSTPSARRATAKTETKSLFSNKLYNILHEFRRALIYNGSKNYPNHAKRLKNPVRRCRKDAEDSPFAPGRKTQNNSRPSCSKGG